MITATVYFYKSAVKGSALKITLASGLRGAAGISAVSQSVIAAENLGGHRAVTVNGFHCSPSNANELAGITTGATNTGGTATYVSQGPMEEPSWSWTPGLPIFLGAAGVLTQSPLTSGPMRLIAWAITATKINVDFSQPIIQA